MHARAEGRLIRTYTPLASTPASVQTDSPRRSLTSHRDSTAGTKTPQIHID